MNAMKRRIISVLCLCLLLSPTVSAVKSSSGQIGDAAVKTVTIGADEAFHATLGLAQNTTNMEADAAELIDVSKHGSDGMLVASITGGFFNSFYNKTAPVVYPANCPRTYATLVRDGTVINGGGSPAVMLGITDDGHALINKVTAATAAMVNGQAIHCWGVNNVFDDSTAVLFFNKYVGLPIHVNNTFTVVKAKNGVVVSITDGSGTFEVDEDEFVIAYGPDAWENSARWHLEPQLGTEITLATTFEPQDGADPQWDKVTTAISGGPWLLCKGVDVTNQNEELTENILAADHTAQRCYAAILSDGSLQLGSVFSSPAKIAQYLLEQGARDAMLFDGGDSTMLYAEGMGFLCKANRKLNNILNIFTNSATPSITTTLRTAMAFDDVKSTDYFCDAVAWAVERGVTDGTTATTFSPAQKCTVAHVLTFLWRAAGKPQASTGIETLFYNDLRPGEYYISPIGWAYQNNIAVGDEPHTFGAYRPVSRSEFVRYLWRAVGSPEVTAVNPFSDVAAGSELEKAVLWAVDAGVTLGTSATEFSPYATCTRGQVVTFLYRYFDNHPAK